MHIATKLGRVGIYNEKLPSIKLQDPLFTWSCKVNWNIRCYISTTTRHMATKLDKVVTYYEKLPTIKSCNRLNMWPRDQLKTSPLPQSLWPPNLGRWLHTMRSFLPQSHNTLWSGDLARSRDKVNTLNIHFHNAQWLWLPNLAGQLCKIKKFP